VVRTAKRHGGPRALPHSLAQTKVRGLLRELLGGWCARTERFTLGLRGPQSYLDSSVSLLWLFLQLPVFLLLYVYNLTFIVYFLFSGRFGLWLDADLYHGRSNSCSTFNNDILSKKEDFIIQDVEVWTFE